MIRRILNYQVLLNNDYWINKMSIIIGINWEQNSSVALLINGKIIEAVSEERFSRLKRKDIKKSIDYIIKKYKLKKNEIDKICFVSKMVSIMDVD